MSIKKNINLSMEKMKAIAPLHQDRDYMGASIIAHSCIRFVWLEYRNQDRPILDAIDTTYKKAAVNKIDSLVKNKVIKDIKYQIEYQNDIIKGTADVVMTFHDNTKVLVEIRIVDDESFKRIIEFDFYSAMRFYDHQCQAYMGLSKIANCIILVVNKNTSKYYYEYLKFDRDIFQGLREKVEFILEFNTLPSGHDKKDARCDMCKYINNCWKNNGS